MIDYICTLTKALFSCQNIHDVQSSIQYILGYLNTLGQTKQFPVHISEFVHISEEPINR